MSGLVLLTTSYPAAGGGEDGKAAAGGFVADVAQALAEETEVHVVAPALEDLRTRAGRLTVHRFCAPRLPLSLLQPGNPMYWRPIVHTLRRGQVALDSVLEREDIAHVLALWVLPSGWWAHRAWMRSGIPYSTWALGSDIWSLAGLPLVRGYMRRVLRDARHRFADGRLLAKEVREISGMDCAYLASARNLSVAGGREKSSHPPYRLAFLGRWHPNKGVDLLFDALDRLAAADWTRIEEVRIAGGGPLQAIVHRRAERLAAAGRPLRLLDYLDREQAASLLQWTDYLLLPSRRESIPVVYSDAMRSGTPVVCTPAGDLPCLVLEGGSGIVASEIGAAAYARALHQALALSPRKFTDRLRPLAAQFDVSHAAQRILGCCLSISW
jgi:Glycosyltransferase